MRRGPDGCKNGDDLLKLHILSRKKQWVYDGWMESALGDVSLCYSGGLSANFAWNQVDNV